MGCNTFCKFCSVIYFVTLTTQQTKKMAESQAKRDAAAAESRKQFIHHAITDAKLARERREQAMRQEIEDSHHPHVPNKHSPPSTPQQQQTNDE
jgi:hypothetical protein